MHDHLEYPGGSASVGATAPSAPEPTSPGQLRAWKLERRTRAAPTVRSCYFTYRVAGECDDELVTDLQAYLRLFCRHRALIEIGDHKLAVHFEAAGEAAIFSGLWTVWAAAGLVPTSRCRYQDWLSGQTAWRRSR